MNVVPLMNVNYAFVHMYYVKVDCSRIISYVAIEINYCS